MEKLAVVTVGVRSIQNLQINQNRNYLCLLTQGVKASGKSGAHKIHSDSVLIVGIKAIRINEEVIF